MNDSIATAMRALAAMADDEPERRRTPWSTGVWSYSADGRMALRAGRLEEFGERPDNFRRAACIDGLLNALTGPTWYDIPAMTPAPAPAPDLCPKCHGATRAKCEACEGDGRVEWEFEYNGRTYDMDADCPVCDGDGRVKCSRCAGKGVLPETPIQIGPAIFNPAYLRIMATLPGCQIAPRGAWAAAVFRFTGGSGAVMPTRG